jgi:hypothetical protein
MSQGGAFRSASKGENFLEKPFQLNALLQMIRDSQESVR